MSSRVIITISPTYLRSELRGTRPRYQGLLRRSGEQRGFAEVLAGQRHRSTHLVELAIGDSSDFVVGEAFHCIQNECFAGGAIGTAQGGFDKTQHFVGRSNLLWGRDAAIGDDSFAHNDLVRLV